MTPKLCACGCGRPVKRRSCRYATPQCVPHALRSAGGRKGRLNAAYRRQRVVFREALARLERARLESGTVRRADLHAALADVWRKAWQLGYWRCEAKYRHRLAKGADVAATERMSA